MRDIHASLKDEYGKAILPYENKWVLNNAGGAMVRATPFLWPFVGFAVLTRREP